MRKTFGLFIFLIAFFTHAFYSCSVFSKVKSDTFKVTLKGKSINVTSPLTYTKNQSVIVVNESLTKVVIKVMKDTGQSLGFMILDSKSFKSLDLLFEDKSVEYYLIPFNPASQKIILKIGRESYDIPFKK